jgi:hypothetical protein
MHNVTVQMLILNRWNDFSKILLPNTKHRSNVLIWHHWDDAETIRTLHVKLENPSVFKTLNCLCPYVEHFNALKIIWVFYKT